jgi:hypothetical protein
MADSHKLDLSLGLSDRNSSSRSPSLSSSSSRIESQHGNLDLCRRRNVTICGRYITSFGKIIAIGINVCQELC